MVNNTLLAGGAESCITPPVGVELIEPRGVPSTGVHDDLYARALVLSDGTTQLALVTMDLVGLDFELVRQVQACVLARTGVPSERLMLTASHTHNSPVTVTYRRQAQTGRNRAWETELVHRIGDVVAAAQAQLRPARLAVGRATAQVGVNRRLPTAQGTVMRPNPAGPVAPYVDVLRVDGPQDVPLALFFSHAAHPVTVHSTSALITADYPGYAAETVRRLLGRQVLPMFAQACGADINVEPLRGGFEHAERLGRMLGEAAVSAARHAEVLAPGTLQAANREANLPFCAIPTLGEAEFLLEEARHACAEVEGNSPEHPTLYGRRERLLWAETLVERIRTGTLAAGMPFRAQGFRLADNAVVLALTHEVFVRYQTIIQDRSPFPHTLTLGYANGCATYVPTADAVPLGGYEVTDAPRLYAAGSLPLQPDGERIVTDAAANVLAALHSENTHVSH